MATWAAATEYRLINAVIALTAQARITNAVLPGGCRTLAEGLAKV